MNWNYHWRTRPDAAALEHLVNQLRTTVIQLRHELTNKEGYAATLELVLKQRTQTIDDLVGKLEQVRAQNRRLDAEAERLAAMVARPQLITAE
jgi:hypothetical protein